MREAIQLTLPMLGKRRRPSKRLWILASHSGAQLSSHHHYLFLDPDDGSPIVGADDLLLMRLANGSFIFYAPRAIGSAAKALRNAIPSMITQAGRPLRARGNVRDVMAVSSRTGRPHGRSAEGQRRRDDARGIAEEALVRLSMEPWGRGELRILDAIASKLPARAHPTAKAFFERERADALSQAARNLTQALSEHALSGYRAAMMDFATFGSPHQLEATRSNANALSVAGQLHLPHIPKPREVELSTLGFSVERFCGFPIELDCPLEASSVSNERSSPYECLGSVELDDRLLVGSLAGISSSFRRLAATTAADGLKVTIRAGVVEELRGFLRMTPLQTLHDDIQAIRLSCDTLYFDKPPCVFHPERQATFVGRQIKGRHHRIDLHATFAHSESLRLSFTLRANESKHRYFV